MAHLWPEQAPVASSAPPPSTEEHCLRDHGACRRDVLSAVGKLASEEAIQASGCLAWHRSPYEGVGDSEAPRSELVFERRRGQRSIALRNATCTPDAAQGSRCLLTGFVHVYYVFSLAALVSCGV